MQNAINNQTTALKQGAAQFATNVGNTLANLTPTGDLYTLATGRFVGGASASGFDRGMAAFSLATLGTEGNALKGARAALEATELAKGGVYALRDSITGQIMRTGRSINLAAREYQHSIAAATKGLTFDILQRTDNYAEQRGLEHVAHEMYNPVMNLIRPISPSNPNLRTYLDAASSFLNRTLR